MATRWKKVLWGVWGLSKSIRVFWAGELKLGKLKPQEGSNRGKQEQNFPHTHFLYIAQSLYLIAGMVTIINPPILFPSWLSVKAKMFRCILSFQRKGATVDSPQGSALPLFIKTPEMIKDDLQWWEVILRLCCLLQILSPLLYLGWGQGNSPVCLWLAIRTFFIKTIIPSVPKLNITQTVILIGA